MTLMPAGHLQVGRHLEVGALVKSMCALTSADSGRNQGPHNGSNAGNTQGRKGPHYAHRGWDAEDATTLCPQAGEGSGPSSAQRVHKAQGSRLVLSLTISVR